VDNRPMIYYPIKHYYNLIKKLTNQTTSKIMEKEIFDTIIKSQENIKVYFELINYKESDVKQYLIEKLIKNSINEVNIGTLKTGASKENFYNLKVKNDLILSISFDSNWESLRIGFYTENINKLNYFIAKLEEFDILKTQNWTWKKENWICYNEIKEWGKYNWEAIQFSKEFSFILKDIYSRLLEILNSITK
jgi:hypothetical protein